MLVPTKLGQLAGCPSCSEIERLAEAEIRPSAGGQAGDAPTCHSNTCEGLFLGHLCQVAVFPTRSSAAQSFQQYMRTSDGC